MLPFGIHNAGARKLEESKITELFLFKRCSIALQKKLLVPIHRLLGVSNYNISVIRSSMSSALKYVL